MNFDLLVVSIFGRGNWLASELATRGWKVALLDLSSQLGGLTGSAEAVAAEDIEGPFGLFEDADLLPSQKNRLIEEGESVAVPSGFSIWAPEGPMEFRSEMTPFLLRARNVHEDVESYLRKPGLANKESDRERRAVARLKFSDNWLAHFAHSIASTVDSESYVAIKSGDKLPLFTSFTMRFASDNGIEKGLRNAQSAGVRIIDAGEIREMINDRKELKSLLVNGEPISAKSFVWTLTSSETALLSRTLSENLFPEGVLRPSWFWTRARFKLGVSGIEKAMAPWTVMVQDLDLPWTSENAVVIRKIPMSGALDTWIRVPAWMKNEPEAIAGVWQKVQEVLSRRLPHTEPQLLKTSVPADFDLWNIFAPREFDKLRKSKMQNLFFDGPERWKSLDWLGQFRHQNTILAGLEKLKVQWDNAARKAAAKAAQ